MNKQLAILVAFIFSGAAALIYEVVWVRPIQFVLGSTVYTVSIILAAFMAGLALGSWIISRWVEKIENLPAAYGVMEIGIGLYGILLLTIFNILPNTYWIIYSLRESFYLFEGIQAVLIFGILLIPTSLMGATFPLLAKWYTEKKLGKGIGELYSANNIGAIIGSFAAGFILIPFLGIKGSIIVAAAINILVGCSILFLFAKRRAMAIIVIAVLLFAGLAFFTEYNVKEMFSNGFYRADYSEEEIRSVEFLYYKEGMYATVAVVRSAEGAMILLLNGKGEGSNLITDLRVNFLLSYLPLLLKDESDNALVIGLGTGTTSGQLSQFVNTTTVEIEPAVAETMDYFSFMNAGVLENPNHHLVITDGRNYLLQNQQKYDSIVQELIEPWQSFSSFLYTKEYFESVKEDLKEDGLFIMWVPIYTMSPEDFRSYYKTFSAVFSYVTVFANIKEDETPVLFRKPELLFVGSKQKINLDAGKIEERFTALPENTKYALQSIGLGSADNILHLVLFTEEEMQGYGTDAVLVTDDLPLLEFSTGKQALNQHPEKVMDDIDKFLEEQNARENK